MISTNNPSGALIIADDFSGPSTHGQKVLASALQAGYTGPFARESLYRTTDPLLDLAEQGLMQPETPPDHFLEAFNQSTARSQAHLLREVSNQLERLRRAGTCEGAVNFSQGLSKAHVVRNRFKQLSALWTDGASPEERRLAYILLDGYTRAFGLDKLKLVSDRDEWAKLFQKLIEQVDKAIDGNPEVAAARADYRQSVSALEAERVSVTVSGENDGDLLEQLARASNGQRPNIPADFYDSPLSADDVVTVGAIDPALPQPDSADRVALYSSPSRYVSFYANGVVGSCHGTSFASPKVAAVLAKLHRARPKASNREIETLASQVLSHPGPQHGTFILDEERAREFLRSDLPPRAMAS